MSKMDKKKAMKSLNKNQLALLDNGREDEYHSKNIITDNVFKMKRQNFIDLVNTLQIY